MVFKTRVVGQVGSGKKQSSHKVPLIIKTVLKLASINGYDDQLRIRNGDGQFLENTNLVDHMTYCMSEGRKLNAESEFIALLAEANVDPSWIPNENVKAKLIALNRVRPAQYRPHPSQLPNSKRPPKQPRPPSNQTRTFTELAPPKEIINVSLPDNEDDDDDYDDPARSIDFEPGAIDDDDDEDAEVQFEENHREDEKEDVAVENRTPVSKNRIRPKILVDRDKLRRKKRLRPRDIENIDWNKVDGDEPRQTRSGKRGRWDTLPPVPDDDTGL